MDLLEISGLDPDLQEQVGKCFDPSTWVAPVMWRRLFALSSAYLRCSTSIHKTVLQHVFFRISGDIFGLVLHTEGNISLVNRPSRCCQWRVGVENQQEKTDLFWTRVWCIPESGAEKKIARFHGFLLLSAVSRVWGRFQNPRQTPVRTKLRLKRFPEKKRYFMSLWSLWQFIRLWKGDLAFFEADPPPLPEWES